MSPRRSSRPRNTQPPPSAPSHSNSASSVSSTRAERSTRSHHKPSPAQKSQTPQSLSSEEADDPAHAPEAPQTRRSKRGQAHDEENNTKVDDDLEDDGDEEEEVTRCVCGNQDYPGPPVEYGKSHAAAASLTSDVQNDEAGSMFIQCDICKVWQHGGCVGIMDEAMSPDEYFCEECRKDFHKLMSGQRG
jgi:DNA mismatch repair ATPase MutL